MRTIPVLPHASAGMLAVLLSACGNGLPDAVPEGYERVGDHVAIRANAASFSANGHVAPVAELFDGGDYALFKLSVDCRDRFATESGTRFGGDGSIRGEVPARDWGGLDAKSHMKPAADKLRALATTSRFVQDPDNDREVMALLFADGHDNAWAQWQGPSAEDEKKSTTRRVQILKTGRFVDAGHPTAYVITAADDPKCTARSCSGGVLGAALFGQVDGRWQLLGHDPLVDVVGEGGTLPPPSFVTVLTPDGEPPLLAIEWRTMHFGEGFGGIGVYGFVGGHLQKVLSRDGWADTTSTSDCTDRGLCTDSHTKLALGKPGGAWPEIVANRTGVGQEGGRTTRIDERTTYRFDGKGAYLEASKSANNTPVVVPTPAQVDMMAAMRPVVIASVAAAWATDPKFQKAEITSLALEPEIDTMYRGQLGVRIDGQSRTFAMRIEVQPGPQYAWSFAKD